MFGLQKTVYSLATLGRMGESYRTETLIEVNPTILGTTVSHFITSIRDTLSSLELMTQDPKTIRGEATHMSRPQEKRGCHLRLEDMNARTNKVRDAHFTAMENEFEKLDSDTDRLGAAIDVLAGYIAGKYKAKTEEGNNRDIIEFMPNAQYNPTTGKIEYRAGEKTRYVPLSEFEDYKKIRDTIGQNTIAQSLLELKLAGAALKATIDAEILKKVDKIKDYPADPHSEVLDAVQTVEGNLGYLHSQQLHPELLSLIERATPNRFTQWMQVYVDHKASPWYARIVGGIGLISGAAAMALGVPQLVDWASKGTIDLNYTPELPTKIGNNLALFLTSAGVGAVTFSLLTLGSDIGSKLARDFRKIKWHEIKEV